MPSARSPGTAPHAPGVVQVAILGSFAVTVDGREVPLPAWRSKQARTLVKILAGHRGRAVTRDRLCDLLWPDDDPARTGHRLSVLLATVRTVLDPAKAWPPDRYIVADGGWTAAEPRRGRGRRRDAAARGRARGRAARGAVSPCRPARCWRGRRAAGSAASAFADETDEWADGLREEVRAAWGRSMRRLANRQLRAGRGPEALGIFARLLAVDPYDEQIHRRLVTSLVGGAGRHGARPAGPATAGAGPCRTSTPRSRTPTTSIASDRRWPRSDVTLIRLRHPRFHRTTHPVRRPGRRATQTRATQKGTTHVYRTRTRRLAVATGVAAVALLPALTALPADAVEQQPAPPFGPPGVWPALPRGRP